MCQFGNSPHGSTDPNGVTVALHSEQTPHGPGQSRLHEDPELSRRVVLSTKDELLAAQVQAFLEASEDVDVDAETVEDILSVLAGEDEDENGEPPSESNIDEDEYSHDEDSEEISAPFPGTEDAAQQQGICCPSFPSTRAHLDALSRPEETWSKQEVKQMLHLLKERGLYSRRVYS